MAFFIFFLGIKAGKGFKERFIYQSTILWPFYGGFQCCWWLRKQRERLSSGQLFQIPSYYTIIPLLLNLRQTKLLHNSKKLIFKISSISPPKQSPTQNFSEYPFITPITHKLDVYRQKKHQKSIKLQKGKRIYKLIRKKRILCLFVIYNPP